MTFYFYEFQGVYGRGHDVCVLVDWKPYTLEAVQRRKKNKMPIDTWPYLLVPPSKKKKT